MDHMLRVNAAKGWLIRVVDIGGTYEAKARTATCSCGAQLSVSTYRPRPDAEPVYYQDVASQPIFLATQRTAFTLPWLKWAWNLLERSQKEWGGRGL